MAVRTIDASRFGEILEQWKKDCLEDNDTQGADIISDVMLQLDDMPTLTPQNEPLTIEQLREMDGEPVYAPETNCWVLITKNQFVPLFTWPDGEQCSAHDWYEQVGPVYRRPPERQEDT